MVLDIGSDSLYLTYFGYFYIGSDPLGVSLGPDWA